MSLEIAKMLFDALQFIATGLIAFYVYISNKQRATNERVAKLEAEIDSRIDDHSTRLTRVEETVRHLPIDDDITAVRDMVSRVGGDVKGLTSEVHGLRALMQPMQHTIELVNAYLLNQNK